MDAAERARVTRRGFVTALVGAAAAAPSVVVPASFAGADDKTDKIKQKQKIDQQIAQLGTQLDDVDKELADVYLQLRRTELEIPNAQKDLEAARAALDAAKKHDEEVGARLRAAQGEERRLRGKSEAAAAAVGKSDEELRRLSLDAYKGGGVPNPASVFVGGADPQEAVDRSMNYRIALESQGAQLSELRTQQSVTKSVADRLTAVRAEIDSLKAESEKALKARRDAESAARKAKDALDALYAAQSKQKADLEAKKKKYLDAQGNLKGQSAGLDKDIQALVAEERRREASAGRSTPVVAPRGAGTFMRPSDGPLSSPFGSRFHPILHYWKLHAGQDFAAACGSPVRAMAAGTVLATTYNSAAGNKVIVDHGMYNGQSLVTSYHHLQGFAVSAGQKVAQGQTVGFVGSTGSSTGCHLHFETHINGTPVDPRRFIG